jgi:hypothetical protein
MIYTCRQDMRAAGWTFRPGEAECDHCGARNDLALRPRTLLFCFGLFDQLGKIEALQGRDTIISMQPAVHLRQQGNVDKSRRRSGSRVWDGIRIALQGCLPQSESCCCARCGCCRSTALVRTNFMRSSPFKVRAVRSIASRRPAPYTTQLD